MVLVIVAGYLVGAWSLVVVAAIALCCASPRRRHRVA